jgi:hypothetical protein
MIWGLRVPLYAFAGHHLGAADEDMDWDKWGFWLSHSLLFAVVYLGLLLLPLTRWRDLLPSKDSFHRYVRILFAVNVVRAHVFLSAFQDCLSTDTLLKPCSSNQLRFLCTYNMTHCLSMAF